MISMLKGRRATRIQTAPATLTIGAGITVQGGSGTIGGYYSANDSLINQGTILGSSTGTLTIGGNNWSNSGTITAGGSAVYLVGAIAPAALGTFSDTAGTVYLQAAVNNIGTTLTLSPSLGNWVLWGGTINGGTIAGSGGSKLAISRLGGSFIGGVTIAAGMTLDGTQVQLAGNAANITIVNGLTLNGTIDLGNVAGSSSGELFFLGSQSLLTTSTGSIVLGGSTNNDIYAEGTAGYQDSNSPATLTIGAGITVQGGSGTIGGYYSANDSLINQGTILGSSTGTLTIGGNNWSNSGTITAGGSAVDPVGAIAPAALGTFSDTAGTVYLQAAVNNIGTTLTLSPSLGNWVLWGGTINGGTIAGSGGSKLAISRLGGSFIGGVTIAAGMTLDGTQVQLAGNAANITIVNGLTLNGTIDLGNVAGSSSGELFFLGSQSLLTTSTGSIVLGGSTNNDIYAEGTAGYQDSNCAGHADDRRGNHRPRWQRHHCWHLSSE